MVVVDAAAAAAVVGVVVVVDSEGATAVVDGRRREQAIGLGSSDAGCIEREVFPMVIRIAAAVVVVAVVVDSLAATDLSCRTCSCCLRAQAAHPVLPCRQV